VASNKNQVTGKGQKTPCFEEAVFIFYLLLATCYLLL